jgi:hypothetical protein
VSTTSTATPPASTGICQGLRDAAAKVAKLAQGVSDGSIRINLTSPVQTRELTKHERAQALLGNCQDKDVLKEVVAECHRRINS